MQLSNIYSIDVCYGIEYVMELKSYNCICTSHVLYPVFCLSVVKTIEPKDEQLCIVVCTINNNICDTDPLDNSSSKAHIKWHCLI